MKLRIYSDVHLEFGKFKDWPKNDCKDIILILSGDIGTGLSARLMIETMCKYYYHVILVTGNHEYYNNTMQDVDARWTAVADKIENFHFLQHSSVIIDDVRFIGGTMWTSLNKGDWFTGFNAAKKMNDYRVISYYDKDSLKKTLDTYTTKNIFNDFNTYLTNTLNDGFTGKTVVATHHAPCESSVALQYKGNPLSHAYYEDMTHLMFDENAPVLWSHGHMHNTSDYVIGNTRIVANPRGYIGHSINQTFNPNLLIEI